LLDAELLAEVYAELAGGRQARLGLVKETTAAAAVAAIAARKRTAPLQTLLTEAESKAHWKFVASLGAGAVWRDYLSGVEIDAQAG
jgi:DNA polymerase-3 subunit epsilon